MNRRKLYRVWLHGGIRGPHYVVAENTESALEEVIGYLNANDLGFTADRVLDRIELLAEQSDHPSLDRLYIAPCPRLHDDYGDGK